jgi:hypothetical protein
MKNVNQSLQSLMKVPPLNDYYQEPKQVYTAKGGWFEVKCCEDTDEKAKVEVKRLNLKFIWKKYRS